MAPPSPPRREDPEAPRKAALAREPETLNFLNRLQFVEVPRAKKQGSPCFPSLIILPDQDIMGRGPLFWLVKL